MSTPTRSDLCQSEDDASVTNPTNPGTPTARRAAMESTLELRRFPRGTDVAELTARLDQLAKIIADPATEPIPEPIEDDPSNSSLMYHIEMALAKCGA